MYLRTVELFPCPVTHCHNVTSKTCVLSLGFDQIDAAINYYNSTFHASLCAIILFCSCRCSCIVLSVCRLVYVADKFDISAEYYA